MTFETCEIDFDYEICTEYPYQIRRKDNKRVVSETINNGGYIILTLDGRLLCKHVVIAMQWIVNDDPKNKTQVDHINNDPLDNRIENLHWVTPSENLKKRKPFPRAKPDSITDLPDDAVKIEEYNKHRLNGYWFSKSLQRIISNRSGKYKVLTITDANTSRITLIDTDGRSVNIGWQKFIMTICALRKFESVDNFQED